MTRRILGCIAQTESDDPLRLNHRPTGGFRVDDLEAFSRDTRNPRTSHQGRTANRVFNMVCLPFAWDRLRLGGDPPDSHDSSTDDW
jgi:hypothetical protein